MAIKELKREWSPCQLGYVKHFLLHWERDVKDLPECCVGSIATVSETDNEYICTPDGWKLSAECEEGDSLTARVTALTKDVEMNTLIGELAARGLVEYQFRKMIEGTIVKYTNADWTEVPNNFFAKCVNLTTVDLPKVTHLAGSAFADCTSLKEVNLPNLVTYTNGEFSGCISLERLVLPNVKEAKKTLCSGVYGFVHVELPKATVLWAGVLGSANTLKSVHLDSLEVLAERAFNRMTALREVYAPSLKTVNRQAFNSCSALETFTFYSKPTIDADAFSGCENLKVINVPWAEGEVANAPWGATNATINYNVKEEKK